MLEVRIAGLQFVKRSLVDEFTSLHHHYRIELFRQLNSSEHPQYSLVFHLQPDIRDQATFSGRIQTR